jgi:GT2 family glycosyltransferase
LLDDDTAVQPRAFDHLVAYLDEHREVGLCGPKLVSATGQLHLSCRLFPTVRDKLARRVPSASARRVTHETEMADWDHNSVREVDYVIGACQVIRRAALTDVGLLDERIFYGPEDIDFCLRLHQAGWRVMYHPGAVVVHTERRVTRSCFSLLAWRHVWGLGYFFWKHGYLFSRRRLYARLQNRRSVVCKRQSGVDHLQPKTGRS